MNEFIKPLIEYFKPKKLPIVVIVVLVLYAIIDQSLDPYNKESKQIEILERVNEISSDSLLEIEINEQLGNIVNSLNEKKEVELIIVLVYLGISLVISLIITFPGYLNQFKSQKEKFKSINSYLFGLIYLSAPISILSFIFNFYIVDNHSITFGIAAILTFITMRAHSHTK